jgi:hypothetical protein
MSRQVFYPYPVSPEGLQLSVLINPDVPTGSDGAYLVYAEDPDKLRLTVKVHLTSDAKDLLREDRFTQEEVSVVMKSLESRKRLAQPLEEVEGGFETSIDFRRRDWSRNVEVQAVLTAAENDEGSGKGILIAWSKAARLVLDEPPFPPGGNLKVEWTDFAAEPGLDPKHLFAIRERGGEPVILLNQGFPEAVSVLESKGTHGAKARVRDATYQMIVHQGWSSLLSTALKSLLEAESESTAEEAVSEIGGWQERILRSWAPHLMPDSDDPFDDLYRKIDRAGFLPDLLIRQIPDSIQARFKTYNGFDGLVRDVLR